MIRSWPCPVKNGSSLKTAESGELPPAQRRKRSFWKELRAQEERMKEIRNQSPGREKTLDKRPYDLWAEVPSPIKTRLRNAFTAYAEECFQKDGILLKAYVPAQVGNLPKEEYLKGMKPEDLPDACFLMDFGECSEATFAALAEKAYEKPEIRAWFPR